MRPAVNVQNKWVTRTWVEIRWEQHSGLYLESSPTVREFLQFRWRVLLEVRAVEVRQFA